MKQQVTFCGSPSSFFKKTQWTLRITQRELIVGVGLEEEKSECEERHTQNMESINYPKTHNDPISSVQKVFLKERRDNLMNTSE